MEPHTAAGGNTVDLMSTGRFLSRAQVAEELNVSESQVYALIRRRELRAMKVGGRGTYRVGRDDLESFITAAYASTAEWIEAHPFIEDDADVGGEG